MVTKRMVGAEAMLQTRVPEPVAEWVSQQAELDGDSIAGWLRRHLIQLKGGSMAKTDVGGHQVAAWVRPIVDPQYPTPTYLLNQQLPAQYVLRCEPSKPGADVIADLYDGSNTRPVSETDWLASDGCRHQDTTRFILGGSPDRWILQIAIRDLVKKAIVVRLRRLGPSSSGVSQ